MIIEFEISDSEIFRSNAIGIEALKRNVPFAPDIYYEGKVQILDNEKHVFNYSYSLIDFGSRIYNFLNEAEQAGILTKEIEFTEDYMPILVSKECDKLILKPKYEQARLEFDFEDFKKTFLTATTNLFNTIMRISDSEVLKRTNYEYLNDLIQVLRIY